MADDNGQMQGDKGKMQICKPRIFTKLHEWGSACALRGYGVMK
jgi:hypothetical protein